MRINMAAGLRSARTEMHKQAGAEGFFKSLLGDALHGAKSVDLVRAGMEGGGAGLAAGSVRQGVRLHNLMNVAHPERAALMQKAEQHAKTLAGGGTLDAAQALEHGHGNLLKRMDTHFLKDTSDPTKYMHLGHQMMNNPMGVAHVVGEEGAADLAKNMATGTGVHAAGQTAAHMVAANRARKYMPLAMGAAGLGGFALAKD